MPNFEVVQCLPAQRERVFALFRRPATVVEVAPPEMGLQLIEAPEVVEVGSRIVVQARRWGLTTRIMTEVVELLAPELLVEEQRQGLFAHWRHERRFVASGDETLVTERIDYEPPGGMLGLMMTPGTIEEQLARAYEYRLERVLKLLASQG